VLIRAVLIGTVLAGLTGIAVFFGLGEALDNPRADLYEAKDEMVEGTVRSDAVLDTLAEQGADKTAKTFDPQKDIQTKKVTTQMTPRATGSFVVTDKVSGASNAVTAELETRFKDARRITNKPARDAIYLEIFDQAIESGNVAIAKRIGDKFSTPELRQIAREKLTAEAQ